MTYEQLRKAITVVGFSLTEKGIYIKYHKEEAKPKHKGHQLELGPMDTIITLDRMGEIDKFEANPIRIWWESPKGTAIQSTWEQFTTLFTFSQYDALSLVVRHEFEKSLKEDMNMLEIDKALEALR